LSIVYKNDIAKREPTYIKEALYFLPAGKSWKDKLASLRDRMKSLDVDAMVVTSLGEIAWLLNIRGNALPYSPFVQAFVVVSRDQLHLFMDKKLVQPIRSHLLIADSCSSEYCTR
jgi:Xaa-Pro aminopeptidase